MEYPAKTGICSLSWLEAHDLKYSRTDSKIESMIGEPVDLPLYYLFFQHNSDEAFCKEVIRTFILSFKDYRDILV